MNAKLNFIHCFPHYITRVYMQIADEIAFFLSLSLFNIIIMHLSYLHIRIWNYYQAVVLKPLGYTQTVLEMRYLRIDFVETAVDNRKEIKKLQKIKLYFVWEKYYFIVHMTGLRLILYLSILLHWDSIYSLVKWSVYNVTIGSHTVWY
jgi:hypothetical protein